MPPYNTLPVQAFNDGFWRGYAHAQRHLQDLSAALAPSDLSEYGQGYRLGYRFGQQQGGLHGTVTPVQHFRAA